MGSVNWKKVILFTVAGAVTPQVSAWVQCVQQGGHCPFTAGTVLLPAVPALVVTLAALFSNPRHRP